MPFFRGTKKPFPERKGFHLFGGSEAVPYSSFKMRTGSSLLMDLLLR